MSFDPEKVERFTGQDYLEVIAGDDKPLVRASDYDQLLALYREALAGIREGETLDNRRT